MFDRSCVSFVGGPFDGHCQPVALKAEEMQPVALFPISRDIFRLFDGKATQLRAAVTSTAVYRADSADARRVLVRPADVSDDGADHRLGVTAHVPRGR